MIRLIAVVILLGLGSAAIAHASASSDARWIAAVRVAERHSPPSLCGPVRYRYARISPRWVLGDADLEACVVRINARRRFLWPMLCTTLIHERHHMAGMGHSRNPRSFMYRYYGAVHPACRTP